MIDLQYNYPILPGQDETFAAALREISQDAAEVIKLPPYGGTPEARAVAAKWLSSPGNAIPHERVLLSTGGHNAVIATMLATGLAGKKIACDPLTYNNFRLQARLLGCPLVACAGDEQGMLPDALDSAARDQHVAAVYLMPTVHNPLGTVMPSQRRQEIVEVARRHGLLIIDDDAYRFLADDAPPHFASLAPECSVFVFSFTKPFAPGLKVAFFTFPDRFADAMVDALRITASGAPRVLVAVATSLIASGKMDAVIAAKRREGAERQRIAREVFAGLPVQGYKNAYHVWLELPEGVSPDDVTNELGRQGIAVTSGNSAMVSSGGVAGGIRVALGAERKLDILRTALQTVRGHVLARAEAMQQ